MRYHSYLNSAKKIIESNWGEEPFAAFLKKYFAANKKYGSTDRKQIAALCYNFYRLGKAIPDMPVGEKIIAATFLCEQAHSDFLDFHKPEWNEMISKPVAEKMKILGLINDHVFPWADELTAGIEFQPFSHSFFDQPNLFLRVRPGKKDAVIKKLQNAGLRFDILHNDCIALSNATKVDALLEIDKEVVIQDHNSQQVLNYLKDPASGIQYPVSSIRFLFGTAVLPVAANQFWFTIF